MTTATSPRFDGTLALQLEFDDPTTALPPFRRPEAGPRLPRTAGLRGSDKYTILEHRRRQAQIAARKALGLF